MAPLLLWRFIIQLILETDTQWSSGGHPDLVVVPMPNAFLVAPLLLWWFLLQFLLEADVECSYGDPPPLVVASFSILIEN